MARALSHGGVSLVLPDLVDVGQKDLLLPPGTHSASLAEIEEALVHGEKTYQRRVELWSEFNRFRTLLRGLVPVQHEFLDGSFVTSRPAPKDTDASFWINAADIDALVPDQQAAFWQLYADRFKYRCDAYLVTPCPEGHPLHQAYLLWKTKTEEAWPAYKNRAKLVVPGVVKGYVEVVE